MAFLSPAEIERVVVCLKWVPIRPEIDPLTGSVSVDDRFCGLSPADRAALEWALHTAETYGVPVQAVTAGSAEADACLLEALAHGATRATRIDRPVDQDRASRVVADELATVVEGAGLVFCGDHSLDRGSGSVPAFLANRLGYGQALGCVRLSFQQAADDAEKQPLLVAERRLDQGRRELLSIEGPTMLSFEGGLELRRAPLAPTMAATRDAISVAAAPPAAGGSGAAPTVISTGPYRPRPRVLPPPTGSTLDRVQQLTGAGEERTSSQQLELEPADAADVVIDQLRSWGYLDAEPADQDPDHGVDDEASDRAGRAS